MYRIFIILFIGLSLFSNKKSNAQSDVENMNSPIRHGYIIINDSIYKQGYIVLATDICNAKYVDFLKYENATAERLSIEDIKEYGFDDVVYVTIPYKGKIVFMRRLNTCAPFVFYFKSKGRKEFFIKKDNNLILLPEDKNELRSFLKFEFENCSISSVNSQLAIYNKERLKYIFERNSTCDLSRIPHFSYGIHFGFALNYLKLDPNTLIPTYTEGDIGNDAISVKNIVFNRNFGYMGGIFLDIPLSINEGRLSFRPEIDIKRVNYSFKLGASSKLGFDVNYYNINLFTRYKSLNRKYAPFVDFGITYSFLDVNNPFYENKSSSLPSYIYPNLSNSAYGLGLGIGLSLPVFNRNYIDMSLRYSFLINQEKMPSVSSIDFVIGVEI